MQDKEKKEKLDNVKNVLIEGAATETVQRYGAAVKEHLVVYSGVDNETGKKLKRGLKKISNYKLNNNLKSQAGFTAEEKYVARQNADKIINSDNTRYSRTDDLGKVNDPYFDHELLDEFGKIIKGSGEQMKFEGSDPKAALALLMDAKHDKYFKKNAIITVSHDFYDGILKEADKKIEHIEKEIRNQHDAGSIEKKLKLEKLKKIKTKLKDSGITNKEAIEARLHPKISTAKDITKVSHRAGLEQAGIGAAIGGGVSLIKNIVSVVKGDKEPKDAAISVAKATGSVAVASYTTAFSGSAIKGCLQNAKSESLRLVSKTNIPSTIVLSTVEIGKVMGCFVRGEITGLQCLERLGEKGTSQLSAAMFAVLGQAAIPIPVVGGVIGSMIGYGLSTACYGEIVGALKDAKIAEERRILIEKECEELIALIKNYQEELIETVSKYLIDKLDFFTKVFDGMEKNLVNQNVDGFISCSNLLQLKLGKQPLFNSFKEFDDLMNNNSKLLKI